MEAKRDQNSVPTLLGTLNTDGETPTVILANPTTNILKVSNGTSGSDLSGDIADRDENSVPVLMAVSSADGITPVAVYANSSGELLVDTT